MAKLTLQVERVPTPIGSILLMTDENENVRALDFEDHAARIRQLLRRLYGADGVTQVERTSVSDASRALEAYFAGELSAIDDLHVETGGTPFQREVWVALRQIPTGQTTSYGALAVRIARPKAVRAVGLANGANPVAIVVPCHRVIGSDASLTGYGGGLERKHWLLQHEGALPRTLPFGAKLRARVQV